MASELKEADNHPVMKEVMIEYSIPVEIVKKPKKKLLKMDKHSMNSRGSIR